VDELAAAARERGIEVRVLREGDDPGELAGEAGADALGIAGGDGSLAAVAQVAIERELQFVCVPFGTRNHFARDLGLDRADPLAALAAFGGEGRRIDVGRVGERLFLNNVSLGAYASLVPRREAHRRRRDALAGIRALLQTPAHPHPLRLRVDGKPVSARVVLIANNAYELRLFDLGARPNLSEGVSISTSPAAYCRPTGTSASARSSSSTALPFCKPQSTASRQSSQRRLSAA
jgi:diacylglycerol kinase family enzyme